jgi:hypothetical protein
VSEDSLSNTELKKVSHAMDILEQEVRREHKWMNGSYEECNMFDYDEDWIDLELKYGVQDGATNNQHVENFKLDRQKMRGLSTDNPKFHELIQPA